MESIIWKEFKIGELFDVLSSKHSYHANQVSIYGPQENGAHPYVVRSALENGVRGYLKEDESTLNNGNTISFAQDTFVCFYQAKPYFTGNKIKVLSPKQGTNLNELTGLFIASALNKTMEQLSWGTGSDISMIAGFKVKLPATPLGEPDYEFMANHIKQIQANHIKQIQANHIKQIQVYIKVAGENNPYLNGGAPLPLSQKKHGEFRLGDLFTVKSNPQLDKSSFKFGTPQATYPYFTRSVLNNGIAGYVEYLDEEHKIRPNCFSVGMLGMEFFYMEKEFYAGQFTKHIRSKDFELTKNLAEYFKTILDKSKPIFTSVLVRDFETTFKNHLVKLPTKEDGSPDFEYMEDYIKFVQAEYIRKLQAKYAAIEEAYSSIV